MHIVLLLFLFFFLLLFVALSLVGSLARLLGRILSFFRSKGASSAGGEFSPREAAAPREGRGREGRKVFSSDEGEYVDFVEIKDESPAAGRGGER